MPLTTSILISDSENHYVNVNTSTLKKNQMKIKTLCFFLCLDQIILKEGEVLIVHVLANAQNLCGLHVTVGLLLQWWMDRRRKKSDRSYSLPTPGGSFICCWHQYRGQYSGINTCPLYLCQNKHRQYILQHCSSYVASTRFQETLSLRRVSKHPVYLCVVYQSN